MRHLALAVSAVLMTASLTSCHDPLGALLVGLPYQLARVNGAGLPWTTPYGGTIDEGWIKIVDDTLAQRYEKSTSPGSVAQWRYDGKYKMTIRRVIIDYGPNWNTGFPGPAHPVDTFFVSGNGLVLRQSTYVGSPDTVVRYFERR